MKKIFVNANISADTVQAQDRDGIIWIYFLNKYEYNIYAYSTSIKIDERIPKDVKYFIKKSNIGIFFHTLFILCTKNVDYFLTGKAFYREYFYIFFSKILKKKTIFILSIVNQIPYLWGKWDLYFFNKIVKNISKIFAISDQIASSFKDYYGKEIPVINLLYIIPNANLNMKMVKKRKKIISIGSLTLRKNPFLFLNIAKIFPDHDFLWIGDGYYRNWIIKEKYKSNINNFKLIKKIKQTKISNILSICDIFLFPSFHEGFPNVIVEALSNGLPVICFSYYGPEAVINEYCGYVVSSPFEMVNKLKLLLNNDSLLYKMKNNCIKRAKIYDGELGINKLIKFIEE